MSPLRVLMPELEAAELAVAGHAVALSQWHVVRAAHRRPCERDAGAGSRLLERREPATRPCEQACLAWSWAPCAGRMTQRVLRVCATPEHMQPARMCLREAVT